MRAALGAGARDARCWWVPGRIEVLGKHTDYAGGRSLLCAVDRGFAIAALPRADPRLKFVDAASGESAEAELGPELVATTGHWSNYPLTVARRVARDFRSARHGMDLAFASDLPPAAGLSSSSALVVGTFLALSDANELAARDDYRAAIRTTEELAEYLGAVESGRGYRGLAGDRGVGTAGGSEDHTAILCARTGTLVQYRFAPIALERAVPFPPGHLMVVAASGVPAEKTGRALALYNRAAERAAAALEAWRQGTGSDAPTLAAALDEAGDDGYEALLDLLEWTQHPRFTAESLVDRVIHFHEESRVMIHAATEAIANGDLARFGALVDRSQRNAERLLGNQVPETTTLARRARELGAVAASAFGAGFGGSVYALVEEAAGGEFLERWRGWYAGEFPQRAGAARFFVTRPGSAASRV